MKLYKLTSRYIVLTIIAILMFYTIWLIFDVNMRNMVLGGEYPYYYYLQDISSCMLCTAVAIVYSDTLFDIIVRKQTSPNRVLVCMGLLFLLNNVTAYFVHKLSAYMWEWGDIDLENMYVFGSIATIVSMAHTNEQYGKLILQNERKVHALEIEKVKAENMRTEGLLSLLKSQIGPHFIFNGFSILSELIDEDPQTANQYLKQLSDICRYTVSNIGKNLVSLGEEMRIVSLYTELIKMRFGSSVEVHVQPGLEEHEGYIPPMSIQLLIENAIKHNARLTTSPLHIEISAGDDYIKVINELKPLTTPAHSTGVGLQNLTGRYMLLSGEKPTFGTTDNNTFEAILPLLKTAQ